VTGAEPGVGVVAGRRRRLPLPGPGRDELVAALLPVALALAVGALVLLATGFQPLAVYRLMLREAFGSTDRVAATLTAATPLAFTGLATAVAFRAGVFNVGVEGSFLVGGLAAAWAGFTATGLPGPLLIALCLAAGTTAGALWALGPGVLRARLGVDEVVTTLMLDFVAVNLTGWLLNAFLLAPGVANSATPIVASQAFLPRLLPPSTLSAGLLLALLLLAAWALWVRGSTLGYELRMVGANPGFAAATGIDVPRVIVAAMLLSGAVGGLGGGAHALGVVHRFVDGFSPGYGFTGIAVALLGRNGAAGVLVAAVLFGALASAGATVQLFTAIPLDIVNVLQGTVMIFAVVQFGRLRLTRGGRS
jgi:general nucleoside transport system permease protein